MIDLAPLEAALAVATPDTPLTVTPEPGESFAFIEWGADSICVRMHNSDARAALIVAAVNALPGLIAEVRRLQVDAGRYQWLRRMPSDISCLFAQTQREADGAYAYLERFRCDVELDDAIDAAIANNQEPA